jgi:hypothetical protein
MGELVAIHYPKDKLLKAQTLRFLRSKLVKFIKPTLVIEDLDPKLLPKLTELGNEIVPLDEALLEILQKLFDLMNTKMEWKTNSGHELYTDQDVSFINKVMDILDEYNKRRKTNE